jgi:hypothetical protein
VNLGQLRHALNDKSGDGQRAVEHAKQAVN